MVAWLQVMIDKPMIPRELHEVRCGENAFTCSLSLQLSRVTQHPYEPQRD